MTVKEASNIQTLYKSSRLGIKEVENQMTEEELDQEREWVKDHFNVATLSLDYDNNQYILGRKQIEWINPSMYPLKPEELVLDFFLSWDARIPCWEYMYSAHVYHFWW